MLLAMRIDRLTIRNFKGFEERSFEFPRSVDAPPGGNGSFHVLIGQNGRGKTSVLDALSVAAGSWLLGVPGQDARGIQPTDIRVRVIDFDKTQRIERQLPVEVRATGVVSGQSLTWSRELKTQRTSSANARAIKAASERAVKAVQAGDETLLPIVAYYGTARLWLSTPTDVYRQREREHIDQHIEEMRGVGHPEYLELDLSGRFASRLDGYRHGVDPRCSPAELLSWLRFEQLIALTEGAESPQLAAVKRVITESVEGCKKLEVHPRLGLLIDIEGQPRLPFAALSDGQRNVVALVGDLAYRAAQLNPHLGEEAPKKTPGVVLIDELDLHLHPRWQRHVVEDLRRLFPEVQFITTTHSPFIVQAARTGEVIALDDEVVTVPETSTLGIEQIAQGLMQVPAPEVGLRYKSMVDVAKRYLERLDAAALAPDKSLPHLVRQLDQAVAPFSDNPAFQAMLELNREVKLGKRLRAVKEGSTS